MTITILGLGYGDPRALTMEAHDVLQNASEVFLRTREHPTVAALPKHLSIHSFDHLYEALGNPAQPDSSGFDAIYTAIADDILGRAAHGDVVYAVPGHPLFGESSVQKILARATEQKIATRVIPGVSFVDAACAALRLDPLARGLQIADATDLARQHFPHLDPDQPALVGQLYSRVVAGDCKLTLLALYPNEHLVTRIDAAGTAAQEIREMPLVEMDRSDDYGLLTTLYVPALARPSGLSALGEVVARLRAPDGCKWDRAQTHQSLRKDLLEECYEVLETLDKDDMVHLREELGDLLLHIFLQAQIAEESGEFLLTDVVADITAKLIRRHPHVFGDVKVSGTDEILANWERIKQAENNGKKPVTSPLQALPALARAQKVAKRGKLKGTIGDIRESVEKLPRSRDREKALGEVLFALAAFASAKQLDAEGALRRTTERKTA